MTESISDAELHACMSDVSNAGRFLCKAAEDAGISERTFFLAVLALAAATARHNGNSRQAFLHSADLAWNAVPGLPPDKN